MTKLGYEHAKSVGWNEAVQAAASVVERWSLPTIQTPSMWLVDKAGIAAEIRALDRAEDRAKESDRYDRCLELLRTTDVMLSMLIAIIPDADVRRQVEELLKRIDIVTGNSILPPDHEVPMIEFGSCWAKIHYKRNITEMDRIRLTSSLP